MVNKLVNGFHRHHKDATKKNLTDENGNTATNDCQNANIQAKHYQKVFNRQVPVDLAVIETKIEQRETNNKLGEIPTKNEVIATIRKSKNNKAPGFSGITTDMLKNLPNEGIELLTYLIECYLNHGINKTSPHYTKAKETQKTQITGEGYA
jgi:hypothetical protein